jgi:HEPN domain-containing protein
MQHDPELVDETRAWLAKAASDIRAAETLRNSDPPLLDSAVFHCQQTAEKGLKAFLTWHSRPFRKTHNLEELGEQCLQQDSSLRTLIDHVVPLTEYAWRYRYPGDPEQPDPEEVDEAIGIARSLYQAILERLPTAVRP